MNSCYLTKTTFFTIILFLFTIKVSAQWVKTTETVETLSLTNSGNFLLAGTMGSGLFRSSDGGQTWLADTVLHASNIYFFANTSPNIYLVSNSGVFLSDNNGLKWSKTFTGVPYDVIKIAFRGTTIFVTTVSGPYRSTDNGVSWISSQSGINGGYPMTMVTNGSNIYLSNEDYVGLHAYPGGVFLWNDSSEDWKDITGDFFTNISSLALNGNILFAGTVHNGVGCTTDNGLNWKIVNNGLSQTSITLLESYDSYVLAGTYPGGVYITSVYNILWKDITDGLPNGNIYSFAVHDSDLFVGTTGGIWKRPLSQVITGIEKSKETLPTNYYLFQNYPNPFNPTTVISYKLSTFNLVKLDIYNLFGEKVAELVNKEEPAGTYKVTFNTSKLASGIYLYKLQAGNYTSVKKMILLK